jgi:hypothetical protein
VPEFWLRGLIDAALRQPIPRSARAWDDLVSDCDAHDPLGDDAHPPGLLADLTSESLSAQAAMFIRLVSDSLHSQRIRRMALTDLVDRFALAALIRQLGLGALALALSQELLQATLNPSGRARSRSRASCAPSTGCARRCTSPTRS